MVKKSTKKEEQVNGGVHTNSEFDESVVLRELLVSKGYLEIYDVERAEKEAKERNISLTNYLQEAGLVTKDLLGQAYSELYHVPYADLNTNEPTKEQVLKIPEEIAKKFNVVLFSENEKEVIVTTNNPLAEGLLGSVSPHFPGRRIHVGYSLLEDIEVAFSNYRKTLSARLNSILDKDGSNAPAIFDEVLIEAFSNHASDIHLEPREREVVIRFRTDGVLREVGRLPKELYENILNRIKVMSGLRVDEHFGAQDGSIRYTLERDGRTFDMRTSIVPTIEGEKIVLRILASHVKGLALTDLGLSSGDQEKFRQAAHKPFGMILVTGPTGSGKTTTLYTLLKLLNKPGVNITTIEEPVEYRMSGINQIQVNPKTNLTFAKGLRSVVRQDPDVILVGEIRDKETAEIAVNAALTGHLLLSTFHANDAATAIPRLMDMGVQPFLISSTIELIVAQRLARKICERCRYSIDVSHADIAKKHKVLGKFFSEKTTTLYQGKGCDACGGTGYRGRTAIFELISVTPEIQELILKNPSSVEIWNIAKKQGVRSMFQDGLDKVRAGVTTLEELQRVAELPDES